MARKNTMATIGIVLIVLVVIVALIGGASYMGWIPGRVSETELSETELEANIVASQCPTTLQTTAAITLKNLEDDTQDDTFDATGYLYKVNGGVEEYDQSITDTTAGSATLSCLQMYRLRLVSSDADEGDNANIASVIAGGGKLINGGQAVEFTPSGATFTLKIGGERHGVLEFKAKDNVADGWMCNSDDACTDYEADGVTFESTTNGTAMTLGATDEFDATLSFRSTKTNTSFDDFGYYILVEAGTDTATVWQEPVLTLNGQRLSKVSLTGNEARQFQAYDWAFLVTGHDISDAVNELRVQMKPQTGQNPSTDLQFDFAGIGAYLSVDGSSIGYGAARDNTAATVVYTVQDVTINIA